jgi:hypothetical protein
MALYFLSARIIVAGEGSMLTPWTACLLACLLACLPYFTDHRPNCQREPSRLEFRRMAIIIHRISIATAANGQKYDNPDRAPHNYANPLLIGNS